MVPQDPTLDAVDDVQDVVEPEAALPDDGRVRLRTPAEIVAAAHAITTGYGGLCLKFVRTCAGIGSKYASAKAAWAGATHRHTGYDDAPAGAFLFMSHPRSTYGHVTVYLGDATVRTTNSSTNRIHTDRISTWTGWGYTVQGWSEDLNGVRIPGLAPVVHTPRDTTGTGGTTTSGGGSVPSSGVVLGRGSRGPAVGRLQSALNRVFPAYSRLDVDQVYGALTAGVVAEFQRRAGLPATGDVDAATGAALARFGVRF